MSKERDFWMESISGKDAVKVVGIITKDLDC